MKQGKSCIIGHPVNVVCGMVTSQVASNTAALFPSTRVPSLGKRARFPTEGTHGEGIKAAAMVATSQVCLSIEIVEAPSFSCFREKLDAVI